MAYIDRTIASNASRRRLREVATLATLVAALFFVLATTFGLISG